MSIRKALEELLSIIEIHQKNTGNNFAWAEVEHAKELLYQHEPEPIYSVGKRWQCDVTLPEEGKKLEIDILKAKIEDLKNEH